MVISGVLNFYSETGTEGGYWAIQDERFIFDNPDLPGGKSWSYDGLYPLLDQDYLKIFNADGSIYWEGKINLKQHERWTESVFGLWIHSDQLGLDRNFWATPFIKEYKGELSRC